MLLAGSGSGTVAAEVAENSEGEAVRETSETGVSARFALTLFETDWMKGYAGGLGASAFGC